MARQIKHSVGLGIIALLFISFLASYCVAQTGLSYIPNVPDWNQPPLSGSTNYCAPVSALNILDYYGSLPTNPITGLVDPADAGRYPANSNTADKIGYFMGTNGVGSPARINSPPFIMPGTHISDQDTGLAEYIAWNTAAQFHPADPAPPAWKTGYNNAMVTGIQGSDSALWGIYMGEIDGGRPVKVDFSYWNPVYTFSSFVDPTTQDTFYVYAWGGNPGSSGGQNPQEQWGPDVGHAVTGVGYIPNWNGSDWAVVHDNWPSTHENVVISWQNLMEIVMVDFSGPSISGPVGYWRFDEGSGTVAYDETSNNNDGTLSGPTWVNRSAATALEYDGGGQFYDGDAVTVPHSMSLDINNILTVEAWVDSVGTDNYYGVVDKYHHTSGGEYGFTLYISGGLPRFTLYSGSNGQKTLFGTTSVRGNTSHHIAATWDGTNIKMYVDTILENQTTWSFPMSPSNNDLGIGKRLCGWGGYMPFDGVIDEVRVYDRALSQNDICYDFEAGFVRGDANGDGMVNVADAIFLINYIFKGGPAPDPRAAGDVNCDTQINVADVVYLINFIFLGGPPPAATCCSDDKNLGSYKAAPPVLTTSYDGKKTVIEIESVTNLQGVQLDIKCERDAVIDNLVKNTQLYFNHSGDYARIGILDLDGIGHVKAGQSSVLEISGLAVPVKGIGADEYGTSVDMIIEPLQKTSAKPDMFTLKQNHPNPFNPTTRINFEIPNATEVSLDVFNVMGQKIATLINDVLEAGEHSVEWNGRDGNGQTVSSGIYFYRIAAGEFSATRKMMLLK